MEKTKNSMWNMTVYSQLKNLTQNINYDDIFSSDILVQLKATTVFIKIFKKREDLLGFIFQSHAPSS